MKIVITAWGNRISPVFDAAGTLLVAEIEGHTIKGKSYHAFTPDDIDQLARFMKQEQINTLICGAISATPAEQIVAHHIHLIPFVSGNVLTVLDSFAAKNTIDQAFMMPGCRCRFDGSPCKAEQAGKIL